METVDAVVVGAGPNGLVAANALAAAGWDVLVVEEQDVYGGAVRSAEVTAPGFVTDMFSAFYPLAGASSVVQRLRLEEHGLRWCHAPSVLAHVLPDDRSVVLSRDLDVTAASVDSFAAGDGDAWRRMTAQWDSVSQPLLDALFTPIPPVKAGSQLVWRLGPTGLLRFARHLMLPVRRLGDERFRGEGAKVLLAGNALHSDVSPDGAGSGIFGWLLVMLGQSVGFPAPAGGAGGLADALVNRLKAHGGRLRLGSRVERVEVRGGRATGVALADGTRIAVRRNVLADVPAPALLQDLVGEQHLSARTRADLRGFDWDNPTLKVNWALSRPIPWTAQGAVGAGTVHLGVDLDGLSRFATDLTTGVVPRDPFLLLGQMTTTDPSRSPAGTESVWSYTHLPRGGNLTPDVLAEQVERMESVVERHAPGFRASVLARHVQTPADLQAADASLVRGAINAGTSGLHQQLVFRPIPGWGRPETPVEGLLLASASAHPGGGVHGAPGWNAARAAMAQARPGGRLWARAVGGPRAT